MRIVTDAQEIKTFLDDLTSGLARDRFAWQGWQAVHIVAGLDLHAGLPAELQERVARFLSEEHAGEDGVLVCLSDGTILCVYHDPLSQTLSLKELNHALGIDIPRLYANRFSLQEDREALEGLRTVYSQYEAPLLEVRKEGEDLVLQLLPQHATDFLDIWLTICDCRDGRDKPSILVVDDDPISRRVPRIALEEDYPVATAKDAAEAIEKHLLLAPDIVFLDINLPDSDGFALLEHIRTHDPDCLVIMFSGNSFLYNRVRALSSGAKGFIPKPFEPADFIHYIEEWKERRNG